jgi:hypothetical protein
MSESLSITTYAHSAVQANVYATVHCPLSMPKERERERERDAERLRERDRERYLPTAHAHVAIQANLCYLAHTVVQAKLCYSKLLERERRKELERGPEREGERYRVAWLVVGGDNIWRGGWQAKMMLLGFFFKKKKKRVNPMFC